jgi:predicted transcriptional regulator
MTITTIKVSTEVRDRLKRQAAADGRTLGEHLAHIADLADRDRRLAHLHGAIAATSPELLDSYREELETWDELDRG